MKPIVVSATWVALLLCALGAVLVTTPPHVNWDVLAYTALAHESRGAPDPQASAYRAVREIASPPQYRLLLEGERRARAAAEAAVFDAVLPYYRVKPAYPALMAVLPGNPARSSIYISWVACLAVAVLVWNWARPTLGAPGAAGAGLIVMCLPFALDLARLSTPDALSVLVVLLGLSMVYRQARPGAGLALLVVSLLVRPDNIFWLIPVLALLAVRRRLRWIPSLVLAVLGVGVLWALMTGSGNYGWATLFEHQFLHPQRALPDPAPSLGAVEIAWVYLRQAHPLFLPRFLLPFAVLGAFLAWRVPAARDLLALAAVSFALRWLSFPSNDERLFVSSYFVVLWALLSYALPLLEEARGGRGPATG